jgi:trimethylamine--corrinoid protein Co-methyltransferase
MDFRTGIASVGCPEEALHCVAATQMARHYGLPSMIWSGISDSKIVDVQAGYESALCLLPTLLAGANRLVCGALESYNSACYESVVIEDEIFGMAKRMAEGIEVNEATMAVPLISKIAPLAATKMGGHFMAEKHTLGYAEKERYIPKISDKRTRETWVKTGSKTLTQVAKERVHEILAKHEPESPASDILRDMNKKAEEIKQRILSRRR